MKRTAAQTTPQPPIKGEIKPTTSTNNHKMVFLGAVVSMSWQLAVVVLVPVVGGFKLDESLDTTPALTILGFITAMAGMFIVLKRTLQEIERRQLADTLDKESNKQ